MSKVKIIGLIIVVGILSFVIYNGRKPALEKVKEQLSFTKSIRVKEIPLEKEQAISCPEIKEEETIEKIVKILKDSYVPPKNQWYNLPKYTDYHLEFLNQKGKTLFTIETNSSAPFELKRKGYKYQIDLDDKLKFMEILKEHCEKSS